MNSPSPFRANSIWKPQGFSAGARSLPLITAKDAAPILDSHDLWDCWPMQHEDGRTVFVGGRQFWFFLSAPKFPDPGHRHLAARIRLLSLSETGEWQDHGEVISAENRFAHADWAGSAVLHDDGKSISLFSTAAGSKEGPGFQQRLIVNAGQMGANGPEGFGPAREIFQADGAHYVIANKAEGEPGKIKAFRDPAWFHDPSTGKTHMLFTASAAWSDDNFNGLIGIATLQDGAWVLGAPLISAIGVNNELERPHMHVRGGRYYLFWSTQRGVYSPETEAGPNGLYAAVSDGISGEWKPVNGTGLIAANPASEPVQSYSWWVTGEDEVWSFIDHWGMRGRNFQDHPELLRAQFGGTPAPKFRLEYMGDTVNVVI